MKKPRKLIVAGYFGGNHELLLAIAILSVYLGMCLPIVSHLSVRLPWAWCLPFAPLVVAYAIGFIVALIQSRHAPQDSSIPESAFVTGNQLFACGVALAFPVGIVIVSVHWVIRLL